MSEPDPAAVTWPVHHHQRWTDDRIGRPTPTGECVCGATWSPAHERDTPGGLVPGEADVPPPVDLGPMLPEVLAARVGHVENLVGQVLTAAADGFVQLAHGLVAAAKGATLPEVLAERVAVEDAAQRADLLTADEHRAVEDAGELYNLLCRIVGQGPSRAGDLGELVGHVHGIQQAVLKQAAARAYPDRYRLLGGVHGDLSVGG